MVKISDRLMLLIGGALITAGCGGSQTESSCVEGDPDCADAQESVEPAETAPDAGSDDGTPGEAAEEELPPDPLRLGSDSTIEIATWNLMNFPTVSDTPARVAELIRRMDIDFVAVQEINDVTSFRAMVQDLPGYEAALLVDACSAAGDFQMTGFIYRTSVAMMGTPECLFVGEDYAFPRPPLEAPFTFTLPGLDLVQVVVIDVHLKAGVSEDDESRRRAGIDLLEGRIAWIVGSSPADGVILLGDMNDVIDAPPADNVFTTLLESPASCTFLDAPLAASGAYSYIPYQRLIDHVMITSELADEYDGGQTVAYPLDAMGLGFDYRALISDHRPVVSIFPGL